MSNTAGEHRVTLEPGVRLMQGAISNSIAGIDCACATCHVFVNPAWIARLGARNEMEASMLEFADGVRETSRLACQIKAHIDLDGFMVHLSAAQH